MDNININLVKDFAFAKHKDQVRQNKKREPKIVHLTEVARLVKKAGNH